MTLHDQDTGRGIRWTEDEDEDDGPGWWDLDEAFEHQPHRRAFGVLLTPTPTALRSAALVGTALLAALALFLFLVVMIGDGGGGGSGLGLGCDAGLGSSVGPDGEPVPAGGDPNSVNATQRQHATTIVGVGKGMNVPPRGWVVALATAMQESNLGLVGMTQAADHDSLGLFQQRPSAGWGSAAQVKDPVYASTQFYGHLAQIPGWQTMPVTQAAQRVQSSAFPSAYAKWQGIAATLANQLTGTPPIAAGAPTPAARGGAAADAAGSGQCPLNNTANAAPAAPGGPAAPGAPAGPVGPLATKTIAAARAEQGKPYVWGAEGPAAYDCSGLMVHAFQTAGVTLPRTSAAQYGAGAHVPVAQAQPGDLLFFAYDPGDPATIHHVGLYAGGGQMVEAPDVGLTVRTRPVQLTPGTGGLVPQATRVPGGGGAA
jgi:cell wall-associated NlpC family hydrolase